MGASGAFLALYWRVSFALIDPPHARATPGADASPRIGRVVSDLHLFSSRSDAERGMEWIEEAAARSDLFVFNGDTFDFRWTTRPSIEATVPEAVDWVRAMVARHERCQFHFVLGNHDFIDEFTDPLGRLAESTPNLSVHPYHVILGDAAFLHGDVPGMNVNAEAMAAHREAWRRERRRRPMLSRAYDVAVAVGAHRAPGLFISKRKAVERLRTHLESVAPESIGSIRRVYFGHIQLPFTDFEHAGMTFYNTGSHIKGLKGEILPFEIAR
jgi:UDP-2,3-diacylglucosamine hydrolase